MTTLNNLKLLLPLAPNCERDRIIAEIEQLESRRRTMTIYEIKRLIQSTSPHFFDRATLKFFGQTMRDFSVKKCADGRYRISAPILNPYNRKPFGKTVRYFNSATNELEREEHTP